MMNFTGMNPEMAMRRANVMIATNRQGELPNDMLLKSLKLYRRAKRDLAELKIVGAEFRNSYVRSWNILNRLEAETRRRGLKV